MRGAVENMKTFKIGNTIIRIHSPVVQMTSEEKKAYYEELKSKKDTTILNIIRAMNNCYKKIE
jgi:hypothetical protein